MPWFNNQNYFKKTSSSFFTIPDNVGDNTLVSGIYRCSLCGHEIVSVKGNKLPPDGLHGEDALSADHLENGKAKKFQWELVAAPKHRHAHEDVVA